MSAPTPSAESEEGLRRTRVEVAKYKEAACAFLCELVPDEPLTEE